jgi:hypothetical protein
MSAQPTVEHEPVPRRATAPAPLHDVIVPADVVATTDLIQHWSVGAGAGLSRWIRHSGALQRYVRGSKPRSS